MEKFMKGDIVVIPFPFSDLSRAKRRPAMVLTCLLGADLILCQITSKDTRDNYSIRLSEEEFKAGSLKQESNVRPNKIFTADRSIIEYKIGSLKETKTKVIVEKVCSIIKR
ncbi:MAG: type II toxin-antitoxin system PemK/MazF family toxin [Candidatus Diapherotrites archaeon]|uniref:Type II toxin-antitoxin system PemK/MazF family toxin n=1 Tax=Candidatus Iainarchaeum sp. TaxID=3101447 RepID=A0A938YNJ1_9ARCH|nr:type II toxin-antitoxin system PemK/MazF family toxin [Candidatus Diapherotrites archaeon]